MVKYWAYFLAKLTMAVALIAAVWYAISRFFPIRANALTNEQEPFAHDLWYTTAMMVFFLFSIGLLWAVVKDQQFRCRTCVRRLRMPVLRGSWPNMMLIGKPRVEYICIYGHGTLEVPEVELTGSKNPDWQAHTEDIWKELEALEESKR